MEEDEGDGPHFSEMDASQRWGRFDEVLGRGAFKVVYKAFDTQEGTEVAWNQVRVSELMSTKDAENKEERDRLFAEIRVLKALKHKNIMSFYDSWYDAKTYTVNFITELFTSGTLRQYRKRHKHIDEEVVKRWAWQILCGLVYLHGHNPPIIHRDLKCDNIFINGSDGVVKIGDLGLATMLRSRTAPQSVLGTPEFMAPELYEEEYDDRVDVYSFGMCLLELSTMEYPYAECKNAAQIYRKVSLGVRPLGLQKVASPELGEFINTCISPRETRPRARQLLKHPYFDSIRKDKALVSSRSDAALAAAGGGGGPLSLHDGASDYGSVASGPVSRTASSLNDMLAAAMAAASGHAGGGGGPLTGPPSASSLGGGGPPPVPLGHPLSRSISTEAHSDKAHSDSASVRSQRSNASELALAVLENIAEEGETAGSSPKEAAPTGGTVTPRLSPPTSPAAIGSPTSSDGCRCDATERRFSVRGSWLDGDKRIQLRLRICEASGVSRTVEFEFDVAVDTAASVASEMVADLELTPEDAAVIATCIRDELTRLSALPEINAHASMSLAKAAEVLENSLTTSALEQAHNSNGGHDVPALTSARVFSGRFSEELERVPPPPPMSAPTPAPPLAAVLEAAAGAAPRRASHDALPPPHSSSSARSSLEREQPAPPVVPALPMGLRPSGASTSSLCSVSSAASIPHSVASVGSQPASTLSDSGHLGSGAAAAAAAVAAAHAATLHRLSPRGTADGTAAGRPPPRPVSPLGGGGPAAPVEMPSPSQRVLRSNSADAMSLLTRTSSMPAGREPAASPLGQGSGALSPGSGILSPSTSVHEKRIPLNKLFENLQDLAASRTDSPSPGLEAAMAAVTAAPGPAPTLPPLPHPAGHRTLAPSSSGSLLEAGNGNSAGDGGGGGGLFRPRSEACLVSLPRVTPFFAQTPGTPASAPSGGNTLAAAADAVSPTSSSVASPRMSADGHVPLLHTTSVPLPVMEHALIDGLPSLPTAPPAMARIGTQALSAPPSKLTSRDVSPARDASLSPTRPGAAAAAQQQAQLLAASAGDAAAHLNGKRPPLKDKEALRRQAANAMKAVELRSLNLLEGGLGGSKAARGVPMAANRSYGSGLCAAGNAPMGSGAQPMANGGMAQQQQQQQGAPQQQQGAPQQQQQQAPPPAGAQQQAVPPPQQQQQQQQQLKMPAHPSVSVMANGISPPAAPAPGTGPAAAPAPQIAVQAPPVASAPAPTPPPSSGS